MSALSRSARICPRCRNSVDPDAAFCPRDGARLEDGVADDSLTPDPYLGTVVAGDIVLGSVIGVGAMGRVYRAHQRGIDRDVAVKILHRELSSNQQLVARFHREAKIASKLQHPHVVEVFLGGQLADGSLYMVMEFLDGVSLAGALTTADGPLSLHRTLAIMLQICDAVGEGHTRGIVHRDLKPENIMLIRRSEVAEWVKVLDFGIAKLTLGEQSMETAAGLIFGTARYISPEGAQGQQVGPAGDVYALATMLYQMLAGRTPFEAEPLGLLIKHIHEEPPDLRTVSAAGAAVPESLARLVMTNLAKEPNARAANGRAFASALAAAAREANVSISDVGVMARMSQLPVQGAASAASTSMEASRSMPDRAHEDEAAKRVALDPTLDDVPVQRLAFLAPPIPVPEEPRSSQRRSLSAPFLALAFLFGGLLTAALLFRFVLRPDEERRIYRERTRAALTEGHYVAPPGESVRDLVAAGLQKWPEDVELRHMRSAAEKEMITMAIAARSSGDLVGARNLARDAFALDGTDNSARYMRAQSEEELEGAVSGETAKQGAPRLLFESPEVVKPGAKVELTARIVWGATGPNAKLSGMKFSLFPNGQTTGGTPITVVASDPAAIKAVFTAPSAIGSYDVSFEANASGTVVRAMRDLDVAP